MEAGSRHFTENGPRSSIRVVFDNLPQPRWNTVQNFLFIFAARNDANKISFGVYQYFSSIKNFHELKIFMWDLVCRVLNKLKNCLSSAFCSLCVYEELEGKASPEVTGDSTAGAEASPMRTLLCEQLAGPSLAGFAQDITRVRTEELLCPVWGT